MGNSMAYTSGAEASARRTIPNHAQETAGRTHDSSLHVSKSVSVSQPTDTVQEMANAANPHSGPSVRHEESLGNRDKASKNPEPVIREDNEHLSVGLPSDSGYGPSLWTRELGDPGGGCRADAPAGVCYNSNQSISAFNSG